MSKTPVKQLSLKLRSPSTMPDNGTGTATTSATTTAAATTTILSPRQTSSTADFKTLPRTEEVPRAEAGNNALEALAASALSLLPEQEIQLPSQAVEGVSVMGSAVTAATALRPSRLAHLIPRSVSASPRPSASSALTPILEDECLAAVFKRTDSVGEEDEESLESILKEHCRTPQVTAKLVEECCEALSRHLSLVHSITLALQPGMHRLLRGLIGQESQRLRSPDLTALLTARPFLVSVAVLLAWLPRTVATCVRVEELAGVVGAEMLDVLMAVEVVLRSFPQLMPLPLLSERLKHLQQFLLEEAIWSDRFACSRVEMSGDAIALGGVNADSTSDTADTSDAADASTTNTTTTTTNTPTNTTATTTHTNTTNTTNTTTTLPLVYRLIANELPKDHHLPLLLPLRSPQKALESLTGFAPAGARLSRLELMFRKLLRLGLQRIQMVCGRAGLSGEVSQMSWEWFVEIVEGEGVEVNHTESEVRHDRSEMNASEGNALKHSSSALKHSSTEVNSQYSTIHNNTRQLLFLNNHLNQILMAILYTVARLHGSPRTFHQLSVLLPTSPLTAQPHWRLRVAQQDYYAFYNECFLPRMQEKIARAGWHLGGWAPVPAAAVHQLAQGVSLSVLVDGSVGGSDQQHSLQHPQQQQQQQQQRQATKRVYSISQTGINPSSSAAAMMTPTPVNNLPTLLSSPPSTIPTTATATATATAMDYLNDNESPVSTTGHSSDDRMLRIARRLDFAEGSSERGACDDEANEVEDFEAEAVAEDYENDHDAFEV